MCDASADFMGTFQTIGPGEKYYLSIIINYCNKLRVPTQIFKSILIR